MHLNENKFVPSPGRFHFAMKHTHLFTALLQTVKTCKLLLTTAWCGMQYKASLLVQKSFRYMTLRCVIVRAVQLWHRNEMVGSINLCIGYNITITRTCKDGAQCCFVDSSDILDDVVASGRTMALFMRGNVAAYIDARKCGSCCEIGVKQQMGSFIASKRTRQVMGCCRAALRQNNGRRSVLGGWRKYAYCLCTIIRRWQACTCR